MKKEEQKKNKKVLKWNKNTDSVTEIEKEDIPTKYKKVYDKYGQKQFILDE